jgi:hypothetical protein
VCQQNLIKCKHGFPWGSTVSSGSDKKIFNFKQKLPTSVFFSSIFLLSKKGFLGVVKKKKQI